MLKNGDVEMMLMVRTILPSQIRVTATLSTEEPFALAQYLYFSSDISQWSMGGWQETDGCSWISRS
jgi:hypothetical protein